MKILVTGGAGFIGSNVADKLIEKGHRVVIIDDFSSGLRENVNSKAIFYQEDLSNHEKIRDIFVKEQPEIIYHFAAQINVRKSVENPVEDARINIINALSLLELAVKFKIKHFIFSSTGGAIYGEAEIPTSEEAKEFPLSPYGCAKLSIEKYLNFYNKVYGLKYTCLRYANVYGIRQNPEGEAGVIAIFLKKMKIGENPVIFGGLQTRDFVYVEDVALANLLALDDNNSDTYNIGTAVETNITEIFNLLNSFFKYQFKAEYKEKKLGEQERSCLSYSKAKENLRWEPRTSLQDGLKKTYEWFLSRKI